MRNAMLAPLLFAAVSGFVLALDVGQSEMVSSPNVEAPVSATPNHAEVLMDRHRCWGNGAEMPADMVGVLPGHAVVVTVKGRAVYSADQVGPALEQLAYDGVIPGPGVDHGIEVMGVCR